MTVTQASKSALLEHLSKLNEAVDNAVTERNRWMDENMVNFAKFKVGDVVYDRVTGAWVGQISKLYRVHQNDPRFDRSMDIDYQFEVSRNCFDNTSRQYLQLATAQQMVDNRWYRVNEKELWERRAMYPETVKD